MKILVVHNTYQQPGGEDVVVRQEKQMLESFGHKVSLYERSNHEVDLLSPLGRAAQLCRTIWSGKTRREFSRVLGREKPEIVHVHNTFFMISPSIYQACTDADLPVVQTLHNFRLICPAATLFRNGTVCEECLDYGMWKGIGHGCYRESRAATTVVAAMVLTHRILRTWANRVTTFIALTEFASRKIASSGIPTEKIRVKPNFAHPDPATGAPRQNFALFVGRLAPEKGGALLIEAWKRLKDRVPLRIIGEGPERSRLEALAARYGLTDVHFEGRKSRDEALAAMNEARFLVFPSVYYESFPVTLAESFACGTPVVCCRLGAMAEIVADGVTGLHASASDPDELADRVSWAWSNPARVAEMGMAARKVYEGRYSQEKNYPMLMEIYRRALVNYD